MVTGPVTRSSRTNNGYTRDFRQLLSFPASRVSAAVSFGMGLQMRDNRTILTSAAAIAPSSEPGRADGRSEKGNHQWLCYFQSWRQ